MKLTAFLELERVTAESLRFSNAESFGTILAMQMPETIPAPVESKIFRTVAIYL
jgi:hypothetical protein